MARATIWDVIKNPWKIIKHLGGLGYFKWIPDEPYIKICYRAAFGKWPNLEKPVTFNEKLNWLKLYDRKPIYTTMVDKYEAKKYVASIIGDECIIPTLGVWDKFDDIDFNALPDQFVLKCTHDSGGLVIVRDRSKFNKEEARKTIEKSLKREFFYVGREWPYKDVKPRIIAEQYMEDSETGELRDYKFFCFGGMVKCFKVDFDRFIEHHANYYDAENNNLIGLGELYCPPVPQKVLELPDSIPFMRKLSEALSDGMPFLRVDFYNMDGKTYFGELTFFPDSGFGELTSEEWDEKLGSWIKLPESNGGGYRYNLVFVYSFPLFSNKLMAVKFDILWRYHYILIKYSIDDTQLETSYQKKYCAP